MTARSTRSVVFTAVLSLLPLAVGCAGGSGADSGASGSAGSPSGGAFRGDGSPTPSFGGWA